MKSIKTILHPTDFSEASQYALGVAGVLAREQGARLVLLHVVPGPVSTSVGKEVPTPDRVEHAEQDLRSYREEMRAKLRHLQVAVPQSRVERLLKEGEITAALLRTAQETACDLIVMGTHGWTGDLRRLMGSVAEAVTRKAPCPVLTVKTPSMEPRSTAPATTEEVHLVL